MSGTARTRPYAGPMRRRFSLLLAGALALGVVSCAPGDPEPSSSPSPSATETPTPTPTPTPAAPTLAPLTGVVVDAAVTGPSIAAKIDNHPQARPQFGLEQADLVFEELVEGGLTRYVGVWHSTMPAQIGPVRSIRPMDPPIISPLGGAVAYSGGQQRFVDAMRATNVVNVSHDAGTHGEFFSRTRARIAPHNVILDAADLAASMPEVAPPPQLFSYAASVQEAAAQPGAAPASRADLAFSQGETRSWACDATSGRWLRSQQGAADRDAEGGQLSAANVVVLRVGISDNGGVPETVLAGSGGEGFVVSGCAWVPVTWSKGDIAAPIVVTRGDGQPVVLAPGNSWIEFVPTAGSASVA